MAALGGLGIWVFGGDAPAAYDKQKPKPNKPRTIDVAYVASSYQANKEIEVCILYMGEEGKGR